MQKNGPNTTFSPGICIGAWRSVGQSQGRARTGDIPYCHRQRQPKTRTRNTDVCICGALQSCIAECICEHRYISKHKQTTPAKHTGSPLYFSSFYYYYFLVATVRMRVYAIHGGDSSLSSFFRAFFLFFSSFLLLFFFRHWFVFGGRQRALAWFIPLWLLASNHAPTGYTRCYEATILLMLLFVKTCSFFHFLFSRNASTGSILFWYVAFSVCP